jgi:tRNA-binding EMAP/Myf-like protein
MKLKKKSVKKHPDADSLCIKDIDVGEAQASIYQLMNVKRNKD